MADIGRNAPCPCGSGRKYKHCCIDRETALRAEPLPAGRFRYEPGSYGGPGGYFPSLLCYKEVSPDTWEEYFCLAKSDTVVDDEDSATAMATEHLNAAFAVQDAGGSAADFALSLRHAGYKNVEGFRVVPEQNTGPK
ncbi:MAG: hypothetical protein A3K19_29035 [Lentisphaerae bacterium RIFOXYB12_FULL_65_16]|nr:MAG: hypothetical protein A3K18_25620 [Lentisphaerae bacterium RIFOXYA12_64_32]OGV88336.1 MAG: hypothetical protein A3K19_29035 [Lentisphaerae bacterium RIFOXYB12_FULL_65_16]